LPVIPDKDQQNTAGILITLLPYAEGELPGKTQGMATDRKITFTDGSALITEALVRSGADMFIGYPITPSNRFYAYGQKRFPVFYPAPDEISVLQWMSGAAAAGKLPVTATAFPGLALMTETLNMAYVMELPMVLVITQRLGPSTGSATVGAQGDLALLNGIIPGFPLPTFCPAGFADCWTLAHKAVHTAVNLRTPVVLLTSKEMVMTSRSFDLNKLPEMGPVARPKPKTGKGYQPYKAGDAGVAPFLPVGNSRHQVRLTASMHNRAGRIVKNEESLAVTRNLAAKINSHAAELAEYAHITTPGARKLLVSYGVSALAARDARAALAARGEKVSLLIIKTLIPLATEIFALIDTYEEVFFVEENLNGQLQEIMFGKRPPDKIKRICKLGSMIAPAEIVNPLAAQ